jgi:subtilisin family serine protease
MALNYFRVGVPDRYRLAISLLLSVVPCLGVAAPPIVAADSLLGASAPAFTDLDGPLAATKVIAWRSPRASQVPGVAGVLDAGRPGWFLVACGSPAASDPRVQALLPSCDYAAFAYVDRCGGLAWPEPAVLVRFRAGVSVEDGLRGIESVLPIASAVQAFSHIPGLCRIPLVVGTGNEVLAAVAVIGSQPTVEFAEPDMFFTGSALADHVPNDPGFVNCWGHRNTGSLAGSVAGFDMRSPTAWGVTIGDPSVKVLVIDTGVDQVHPDINQVAGRDFTNGSASGAPGGGPFGACENHGTAVAGCVSAKIDNALGTVGSAPGCLVVSARCFVSSSACDGSWTASYSYSANAVNWAIANGIRVTNNSNYYGSSSTAVAAAYDAARSAGIVHFASAGNNGNTLISFPASLSSVNAIGAMSPSGSRSAFSNYGSKLFVMAPGSSVYTTDRTGSSGYSSSDYVWRQGTSFASPYTAGVAALMLSVAPALRPAEIEAALAATARDLGSSGFDDEYGWGMVDAAAAVASVPPCFGDLNVDRVVNGADLGRLLGSWGSSGIGDLNRDAVVNGADLGLMLGVWGACP